MKVFKILIAAIVATAAPLSIMWMAPYVGLPKVHLWEIVNKVYGGNKWVAAFLFLSFRIILAFVYVLLFNTWEPVRNNLLRGMFFGLFVFLYSETNLLFHFLSKNSQLAYGNNFMESTLMVLVGSLMFGSVLGLFFPRREIATK